MQSSNALPSIENMEAGKAKIQIDRWFTEIPLLVLLIVAAIGIWAALIISIIGIIYALLLAVAFFVSQILFVAHIRGNGIRLSATQFPELFNRVETLSARAGLKRAPEAYVIQAGGSLNALAVKFLRSRMVVLYSDLLEACGDNESARDMIIGHEIGHIAAGHLNWIGLILPGFIVPFLGSAYSRAREYTCDRYGAALASDRSGALIGLAILAAGGKLSTRVNLQSLVDQKRDLNTGWMTFGRWMMSHPPLCDRIAALNPVLAESQGNMHRGPLRAIAILALCVFVPLAGASVAVVKLWPQIKTAIEKSQQQSVGSSESLTPARTEALRQTTQKDFAVLAAMLEEHCAQNRSLPDDYDAYAAAWKKLRPGAMAPVDPFDGSEYGYQKTEEGYYLWSAGPDGLSGTNDDLVYRGRISQNRQ